MAGRSVATYFDLPKLLIDHTSSDDSLVHRAALSGLLELAQDKTSGSRLALEGVLQAYNEPSFLREKGITVLAAFLERTRPSSFHGMSPGRCLSRCFEQLQDLLRKMIMILAVGRRVHHLLLGAGLSSNPNSDSCSGKKAERGLMEVLVLSLANSTSSHLKWFPEL